MTSADESTKRRRRPGWQRKLLAIAMGLLPFVVLEAGLRIAGVGAKPQDLHAGFGGQSPLFEADGDEFRTSVAKEQFFVQQQFAADKPADEFRIFCLGGSTVQGRPYRPETSFAGWLEVELNSIDRGRTCNVVNCGGVSYASYRLVPVLEEVLNYDPDLIIVATGHNEFLEDRTYQSMKDRSGVRLWVENQSRRLRTVTLARQLLGRSPQLAPADGRPVSGDVVQARLDADEGYAAYERDDEWHQQVAEQFSDSVDRMIELCHDQNVPLLLVQLGANLRDCPPFKSAHRADLGVGAEQQWQRLFDQAHDAEVKNPAQALKLYEQAAELDDQYALLHFRMARCYEQLQQYVEARQAYQAALNADICPLRITSELTRRLNKAAAAGDTILVDVATPVAEAAPDRIPGYESYIDHVHPSISTHQRIARKILEQLQASQLVAAPLPSAVERRRLYSEHFASLPEAYFSNGRRRIGWVEGWARRQRLADEVEPVDGAGYLRASLRSLDLHDYDRAADQLLMTLAVSPDQTEAALHHAVRLAAEGRPEDGAWMLQQIGLTSLATSLQRQFELAQLLIERAGAEASSGTNLPDELSKFRDVGPAEWRTWFPELNQPR
ncbi:MAG: tetratricopeptide repeat protein [Fuerstiella sp.]